jgi:hypothetical protein
MADCDNAPSFGQSPDVAQTPCPTSSLLLFAHADPKAATATDPATAVDHTT